VDGDGARSFGCNIEWTPGVSVYRPNMSDAQMADIDLMIDDGDLSTGCFRKRGDGFNYIIEQ